MFDLLSPDSAPEGARALLDATRQQLGRVPNLYAAMANSPVGLEGYLAFRGALQRGALDTRMRERIALLVAELNDCDYCVAAHTFRGGKIGIDANDLLATRRGSSNDAKTHSALQLVVALVRQRTGEVDERTRAAIAAGWSEAQIGEMVAHVALNVFSNYFKQIAHPPLDFPAAPALAVPA